MKNIFVLIITFVALFAGAQEIEPLPFTISYYAMDDECFNQLQLLLVPGSEITLRATNEAGQVYGGFWRTGKTTNGLPIIGLAGQPITHIVLSTPRSRLGQISLELSNKVYGNEVFLPYMLFWEQHSKPLGTNGTEYIK